MDKVERCRKCQVELNSSNWYLSRRAHNSRICIECDLQNLTEYRKTHKDNRARWRKQEGQRLRKEMITAYGGVCTCCGIDDWRFLTIDHINGGGNEHRRELGTVGGQPFFRWLRNNGYPKDNFQVLCMNCNVAKSWYGQCPHKENLGLARLSS